MFKALEFKPVGCWKNYFIKVGCPPKEGRNLKWSSQCPGQECSAGTLWQPSASRVWWLSKMSGSVQACVCACVCARTCGLLGEEDLAFWVTKGSAEEWVRGAGWAPGVFLALEGGGNVLSPVSGDTKDTARASRALLPVQPSPAEQGDWGSEAPPAPHWTLLFRFKWTRMTSCTSGKVFESLPHENKPVP